MICATAPKLYVGAVARRIEIELTSARPDGTWTWRAAGALQPKGTLDASVLYNEARVGDVVRAEAEFGIDGITVVSVEPPRSPEAADPNRIELLERPAAGGVTTQLTGGRGRSGADRGDDRRRQRGTGSSQPGASSQRPSPGLPASGPRPSRSNGNGAPTRSGTEGEPGTPAERPARPRRTERQPRRRRYRKTRKVGGRARSRSTAAPGVFVGPWR